MKIYNNVSEIIGKTPLLRLCNIEKKEGAKAQILAKLEMQNPAGSAKDRVAKEMIESAERAGLLKKGSVIIEPTSGNTGIGLASVGASLGYKVILTMPASMSAERRSLLAAYGAEIVLTDADLGMSGAIEKAKEIAKNTENSFLAGQFENPANPLAHYKTTGREIWEDTDGKVDIFVAGAGTGGTVSGTARYLKEKNPDVKIVAFEPANSAVISGDGAGTHGLQGIGAGFIPENLDLSLIDEVIKVEDKDAFDFAKALARSEGILVGITSGAAAYVASVLAKREENRGKIIVALLPDSGERYLSTGIYND
ncbi:MAG: cysteine synthase A [Clostridia bacterium]|nr:cysteine synthase A [Clostridia bacterium]